MRSVRLVAIGCVVALASCDRRGLEVRTDDAALAFLNAAATAEEILTDTVRSADGQWFARNDSVGEFERTVVVRRSSDDSETSVITVRESDPGSGRSHQFAWTPDSKALVIVGSGSINGASNGPLCLVYRVEQGDLIAPSACPSR